MKATSLDFGDGLGFRGLGLERKLSFPQLTYTVCVSPMSCEEALPQMALMVGACYNLHMVCAATQPFGISAPT